MSLTSWVFMLAPVLIVLVVLTRQIATVNKRRGLDRQVVKVIENLRALEIDTFRIEEKQEHSCRVNHEVSVKQSQALDTIIGDSNHGATG